MKNFLIRAILILLFFGTYTSLKSQIIKEKNLLDSIYTYSYHFTDEVLVLKRNYYTYFGNGMLSQKKERYPYGTYILNLRGIYNSNNYFTGIESTYDTSGNLVIEIRKEGFSENYWYEGTKQEYYYNSNNLPDSMIIRRSDRIPYPRSPDSTYNLVYSYAGTKYSYKYNDKNQLISESLYYGKNTIPREVLQYLYNEQQQLITITDSFFRRNESQNFDKYLINLTQLSYTDTVDNTCSKEIITSSYSQGSLYSVKYVKSEYNFNDQNLLHTQINEVFDTIFPSQYHPNVDTTYSKVKTQKEYNADNQITHNKLFSWNKKTASWDFFVDERTYYNGDGNIIKITREEYDGYNKIWTTTLMSEYFYSKHSLINDYKTSFAETFKIFPNPASHILNIQLNSVSNLEYETIDLKGQISNSLNIHYNNAANLNYEIIDFNGQIMLTRKLNCESINISSLNQGMYIIKLFNKNTMMQNKFIKTAY